MADAPSGAPAGVLAVSIRMVMSRCERVVISGKAEKPASHTLNFKNDRLCASSSPGIHFRLTLTLRTSLSLLVHTLRSSQTTNTITIIVPTTPKPSILSLL
jgi:hypothetical protein